LCRGTWPDTYIVQQTLPSLAEVGLACETKLTIALMNSYEGTMEQEHFALGYESFSCYNHSEYLSYFRVIFVAESKKEKWHFCYQHFCVCLSTVRLLNKYRSISGHKGLERGRLSA